MRGPWENQAGNGTELTLCHPSHEGRSPAKLTECDVKLISLQGPKEDRFPVFDADSWLFYMKIPSQKQA